MGNFWLIECYDTVFAGIFLHDLFLRWMERTYV